MIIELLLQDWGSWRRKSQDEYNFIRKFMDMDQDDEEYDNMLPLSVQLHDIANASDMGDLIEAVNSLVEIGRLEKETDDDEMLLEDRTVAMLSGITTQTFSPLTRVQLKNEGIEISLMHEYYIMTYFILRVELLGIPSISRRTLENMIDACNKTKNKPPSTTVQPNKENKMERQINKNKDAFISAGKLTLGKTGLQVVREFLKKQKVVPTVIQGYLDSPLGDMILANLLVLVAQQFPDQRKLKMVSDSALEAAHLSFMERLNVPKLINSLIYNTESMGLFKEMPDDEPIVLPVVSKKKK